MTEPVPVLVQNIELEQFRAYSSVNLPVAEHGIRLIGPNGSGKSTIVESLLLLSTTRSRRGILDADLIRWGSGEELGVAPYARVVANIDRGGVGARIEVFLEMNPTRGTTRKVLKVADRARRAVDVVGLLPTVAFSPEDLDLVLGTPQVRRRWIDVVLSQTDRKYLRFLSRYTRILSQRNGLLRQFNNGTLPDAGQFEYWDEQLSALGAYIIAARAVAAGRIAARADKHFHTLAPGVDPLRLEYQSTLGQEPAWWHATMAADSADAAVQRVGGIYERQLKKSFSSDVARGVTQIGPHRDDVVYTLGERQLARFGSRGQQRLAVVALKLAEADFIADVSGYRPVFMLDDVLSELDPVHRGTLIENVRHNGSQLIVTATEPSLLEDDALSGLGTVLLDAPGHVQETAPG